VQDLSKKLAECEAHDLRALDHPEASREQKMQRLVLELVKQREQTYLNWLHEAIRAMHTLRDRNTTKPT
jgi:hypothetical protein